MSAPRILIVDDSPEMTDTVARYLSVRGFAPRVARSGDEALALAREAPFDAVVTDLRMSGLDGLDVLAGIQALDRKVPVILMTAFGSVRNAVEAIHRGAFDYLTKPFSLADLRALLDRALAARPPAEAGADSAVAARAAGPSASAGVSDESSSSSEEPPAWRDALDVLAHFRRPLASVSDGYVEAIVRAVQGNKAKAAEILGVDPSTIYRRQRRRRG